MSRREFEELVRDLHVDEPSRVPGPTEDLRPEDVVMPKTGGIEGLPGAKRTGAKPKRPRNRRHGRSR